MFEGMTREEIDRTLEDMEREFNEKLEDAGKAVGNASMIIAVFNAGVELGKIYGRNERSKSAG